MSSISIMLAKNGDIMSILPILYARYKATGRKQILMVSKDYAPLLEGFTYIEPFIFDGHFSKLKEAMEIAKRNFQEVVCLQVFGQDFPFDKKCPSFQQDQWLRGGMLKHFGRLPLVADGRNAERETRLLKNLNVSGRFILVADYSESSPFPGIEPLIQELERMVLAESVPTRIVRLSSIRAERIYDLLALYDRALALISIETSHIHLSAASEVPTFVLATDTPSTWHGSANSKRFRFYCKYGEFNNRKPEFFQSLKATLLGHKPPQKDRPKISCIIPVFKPERAMLQKCVDRVSHQVDEIVITMERNGVCPDVKSDKPLKIVRCDRSDIGFGANVNFGVSHAKHDNLLVLNNDVYLQPDAVEMMLDVMDEKTGIVGMLTRYPNGTIYHSGKRRVPGVVGHPHVDGIGISVNSTILVPEECENTNGASILLSKQAFMEAGGFDEGYKFYCEDDDICMKIRQNGWKIFYTPFAEGIHDAHKESAASSMDRKKVMLESNELFAKKWGWYFKRNNGVAGLGTFK